MTPEAATRRLRNTCRPASSKKTSSLTAQATAYPEKNFFPASIDEVGFVDLAAGNFRLAPSSPYKKAGTKKKDIGADINAIDKARKR